MFKTKSSKLIGLLAIAGLAVGSGAAFTASNTFGTAPVVAGYGAESVSGATVTDTAINQDVSTPGNVTSIAFTTTTDLTTNTSAVMTLELKNTSGTEEPVTAANTCVSADGTDPSTGPYVTTCTFTPGSIPLQSFDDIGFTVSSS